MQRVILTTGGTGGHIFPALAVAEELRRRYPELRIVFMGGLSGPEACLAAEAGLEYRGLPVQGFFGRGLRAFSGAWSMLKSIWAARSFIKEFKPDLVAGFGGYASVAGVLGAFLTGCPTAVHEQNSLPGMANRLAGCFATRVFISMPDAAPAFRQAKTRLTGNPVRLGIAALHTEGAAAVQAKENQAGNAAGHLLIMGGSQGARAINEAALAVLPDLLRAGIKIRWQAGANNYAQVKEAVSVLKASGQLNLPVGAVEESLQVEPFFNDMAALYAWAGMVVSRAGATSVAELACAGLPAVLVPFPYATHDHQRYNAMQMQGQGAAIMLEQKDITPEGFKGIILDLFKDNARRQAMQRAAMAFAKPDAASRLADELEILSEMRKRG